MASDNPNQEPMTGTWAAAYPGRFLAAADIGTAKPCCTIEAIQLEKLEGEKGLERKVIVTFAGKAKQWVVPKLCSKSLVAMFGDDPKGCIGKRVVLYATADLMPMKRGEPCLRVWGSPDIDRDISVSWKPKKRQEQRWVLHATGKPATPPAPPQPAPSPEPARAQTPPEMPAATSDEDELF